MKCSDVLDLVEPIAAGDLLPDERVRDHLHSCPQCAGALASAQRLEAQLKGMEFPAAPPAFATQVLQRIRRDKWQSEQNVDRLFNLAIVTAVILLAGGVLALLNVETLISLTASAWTALKEGSRETARTAAPTVGTYIAAVGLLASALGMWAWAERRAQF
jgi:predicted anti-sigma-YlaC factor YlaD